MKPVGNLALLGAGLLGRAVAERLQSTGYAVTVYNRTASKALPLQQQGISVAATPELALAQADDVLLFLADVAAIKSVLLDPACAPALHGKTFVQMGTIGPAESRELHHEITERGGSYCEAPVLGSVAEAKAGSLLVMAGASEEQFRRLMPLFTQLGRDPRLVGPVGNAAALKLALNQLIAAEMAAFAVSLGLVQRAGLSVDTFMSVLRESALFAPTFEKKLPRLLKRDYHQPNFPTKHLLKDVDLIVQEVRRQGLEPATVEGLRTMLQRVVGRGLGDVDYSSLYEVINPANRR